MNLPRKKDAIFQIVTNILLWLVVGAATGVLFAIKANSPTAKFPINEITKFIDIRQFATICVAGFLLFGMFALIRHKSISETDDERAKYFSELALNELASVIINFGSLLLACFWLGASAWYFVAVLISYFFAYWLKPNEK